MTVEQMLVFVNQRAPSLTDDEKARLADMALNVLAEPRFKAVGVSPSMAVKIAMSRLDRIRLP